MGTGHVRWEAHDANVGRSRAPSAECCTCATVFVASSADCSRQMAKKTVGYGKILCMTLAQQEEQEGQSRLDKTLWALVM